MSRGPNGGSPFNLNADEFSQPLTVDVNVDGTLTLKVQPTNQNYDITTEIMTRLQCSQNTQNYRTIMNN